ncbi:hypothetical protein J6590_037893 [Homalodisca vitripennis]|nr:hypothetical protein J6590_037893 [Homalodisca vitripennis]
MVPLSSRSILNRFLAILSLFIARSSVARYEREAVDRTRGRGWEKEISIILQRKFSLFGKHEILLIGTALPGRCEHSAPVARCREITTAGDAPVLAPGRSWFNGFFVSACHILISHLCWKISGQPVTANRLKSDSVRRGNVIGNIGMSCKYSVSRIDYAYFEYQENRRVITVCKTDKDSELPPVISRSAPVAAGYRLGDNRGRGPGPFPRTHISSTTAR